MTDLTAPVWYAFYSLTARHLPLIVGRDNVYASPEAARQLLGTLNTETDMRPVVSIDSRLRGTEMRLERKSRR